MCQTLARKAFCIISSTYSSWPRIGPDRGFYLPDQFIRGSNGPAFNTFQGSLDRAATLVPRNDEERDLQVLNSIFQAANHGSSRNFTRNPDRKDLPEFPVQHVIGRGSGVGTAKNGRKGTLSRNHSSQVHINRVVKTGSFPLEKAFVDAQDFFQ
jgi:hypothetical protein